MEPLSRSRRALARRRTLTRTPSAIRCGRGSSAAGSALRMGRRSPGRARAGAWRRRCGCRARSPRRDARGCSRVTVSRSLIVNDDVGVIRQMVAELGRAARRTVAREVWALWAGAGATYGPDRKAWFHTYYANLSTGALSSATL